jgi:hypothetical protein
MPYLLAVGLGILSWLAAVILVAALLLGGLLLLNAFVQRYWPQDVRQPLDSPIGACQTLDTGAARPAVRSSPTAM